MTDVLAPTIHERGVSKTVLDLRELGRRGSDMRPIASHVRRIVQGSARHRFDTSGWRQLAEATKARKAAQGLDPRILRATERLYYSLTSSSGSDQVDKRQRLVLAFGTSVPYARFHQIGTGTMPARPVLDLTVPERQQVTDAVRDWVAEGRTT